MRVPKDYRREYIQKTSCTSNSSAESGNKYTRNKYNSVHNCTSHAAYPNYRCTRRTFFARKMTSEAWVHLILGKFSVDF